MPITRLHRPFATHKTELLVHNTRPPVDEVIATVVGIDRGISSPSVIVELTLHPKIGALVTQCLVLHGQTMYGVRERLAHVCELMPDRIMLGPDGGALDPHSGTTDIEILSASGVAVFSLRSTPWERDQAIQQCLHGRGDMPRLKLTPEARDVACALSAYEAQGPKEGYQRRGRGPTLHVIDALGYAVLGAIDIHRHGRAVII